MSDKPMTKEEFVNLLQSVLKNKKQPTEGNKLELVEPYDELYNKCVLGYEISYAKKAYAEDKMFIKTEQGLEGSTYLKNVLSSLIESYGKDVIAETLRDL